MQTTQSRRSFLAALSSAGAAGFIGAPPSVAQEALPETTTIRLARSRSICIAPQYVAEELLKTEGFTDEEEAPALPEVALTGPGDLWILGNHRLLCGDSTSIHEVERLMDVQKADLVFTDPPYNVDYEGYTEEKLKIQGDQMTPEQFREFLASVFSSYVWALKPGGSRRLSRRTDARSRCRR